VQELTLLQSPRPYSVKVTLHSAAHLTHATEFAQNYGYLLYSNSAYDPTGSYAAESPRFYDEWASLYGNYAVVKTRYRISGMMNEDDTNPVVFYSIHPTLVTTDHKANEPEALITYPEAKWDWTKRTVANEVVTLEGTVDNLRWAHIKDYQDNDSFTSATTTNPVFLIYLELLVKNLVNADSAGHTIVEMWQDVIFFAPKDVAS
jgi:hypothetical protein